jgi:hypothetical protein
MLASYAQPLLPGTHPPQATEAQLSQQTPGKCPRTSIKVCLALLAVFVTAVGIWLGSSGMFASIRRDLAFNGTHVFEPNTGLAFPVQLKKGADGKIARPQRIIGLHVAFSYTRKPASDAAANRYLNTYDVADAKMRVLVSAIYVDRQAGRRVLHPYKTSGVPAFSRDRSSDFAKFVNSVVVTDDADLTLTFYYHILCDVAQRQMADGALLLAPVALFARNQSTHAQRATAGWFNHYQPYLMATPNMTSQRYASLHTTFDTWVLPNGGVFHKNKEFVMEWKDNEGIFMHAGQIVEPRCRDRALRIAWGLGEFNENGKWDLDLLGTLWDSRWDDV